MFSEKKYNEKMKELNERAVVADAIISAKDALLISKKGQDENRKQDEMYNLELLVNSKTYFSCLIEREADRGEEQIELELTRDEEYKLPLLNNNKIERFWVGQIAEQLHENKQFVDNLFSWLNENGYKTETAEGKIIISWGDVEGVKR